MQQFAAGVPFTSMCYNGDVSLPRRPEG